MRNKKLLIILLIVAAVVVLFVVLSAVFAVAEVTPVYHNENGTEIATEEGYPTINDVLKECKGKSIIFLSKQQLLDKLNKNNTAWYAIAVVKNFPNRLEIHFVKRVAVLKVTLSSATVYVDTFGYIVDAPENDVIDVTNVFNQSNLSQVSRETGTKLTFPVEEDNVKLQYVLEAVSAAWQLKYGYVSIPQWVQSFDFGGTDRMTITTKVGAKIIVKAPQTDLNNRLINAFSIYFSNVNLQQSGVEITCEENGKIVTPKN